MNIHEVRIALTVDDFDRAVAFYRDALRLSEMEAWDRPDGRGLILDAGRATLELFDQRQAGAGGAAGSAGAGDAGGAAASARRGRTLQDVRPVAHDPRAVHHRRDVDRG